MAENRHIWRTDGTCSCGCALNANELAARVERLTPAAKRLSELHEKMGEVLDEEIDAALAPRSLSLNTAHTVIATVRSHTVRPPLQLEDDPAVPS